MSLIQSLSQAVGNTPLLKVNHFMQANKIPAGIYVKLECMEPAGSAKDRAALQIIRDAEQKGLLCPGGTIIEPTSGNTGIGLAAYGIPLGYKVVLTMPDSMSLERRTLLQAYGAELVLTPGADGMSGAVRKAEELHQEIPGSIIAGQFDNPANPEAHYRTTGPEIYEDLEGKVDIFVAGIGTGGSLSGTARYLREKNASVQIVGVEPATSPLITKGYAGAHGLQGIGANFIPENYDASLTDEVLTVTDEEAYEAARQLARTEGVLTGITSGAALHAACVLARRPENRGKNIVALLPDTGDRYLSTPLYGG